MEEETAAASEPQLTLKTTEKDPLDGDDGVSVDLASGDLALVPVTAMAGSRPTLQPEPLRDIPVLRALAPTLMPQISYTVSGGDLIHGLKELGMKTREVDRLTAALAKMANENDQLKALASRCTGCACLREELKLAHERICQIEEEFHLQRSVFHSGKDFMQTQAREQKKLSICNVWSHDVDEAFDRIKSILNTKGPKLFAAIDTEFCRKDGVIDPHHAPISAEGHYEQAYRVVNGGDLVQVGIFLACQTSEAACDEVFQFNLKFDSPSRHPASWNVAFLRDNAKMELTKHATDGIPLPLFINRLNDSGLLRNQNITWVTFQCYSDFSYIIRGIKQEDNMPTHGWQFSNLVRTYFPSSYDVKVFHELGLRCTKPSAKKGSHSLSALVSGMGVVRLGHEHGSAADAHATMCCFSKMILSDPAAFSELRRYKNLMYGVIPSVPLDPRPTSYADAVVVDVWEENFEREAKVFAESFSAETVLAVEIQFLELPRNRWYSYAAARKELANSGTVDVCIAASNWSGNLTFGRLWVFHLLGAGKENTNRIDPAKLAQALKSCGAVLNARTRWTSSSEAAFLYLMPALTVAGCLPQELPIFHSFCISFFPNFCVLQVAWSKCYVHRRAHDTLHHFLEVCYQSPVRWFHDLIE